MNFSGKKETRGLIFAALAALCTTACAATPEGIDAATSKTSSGRYLVDTNCAACHAIGLSDRSKHPDAPAFRTLSRNYPISALEESLAEGIVVGHPDMPEFVFRAEEIAAIVLYLEGIQQADRFPDHVD